MTGGNEGALLSSTELLVGSASAWVFTGELPSPRNGLRGANIGNKILMTGNRSNSLENYEYEILLKCNELIYYDKYLGGYDGSYYDEILEFDPLTGQWELVDRMIQGRRAHAVSVINYSEVAGICN